MVRCLAGRLSGNVRRRVNRGYTGCRIVGGNEVGGERSDQLATKLDRELPAAETLVVDDTGFPKKGSHSVGVARQYGVTQDDLVRRIGDRLPGGGAGTIAAEGATPKATNGRENFLISAANGTCQRRDFMKNRPKLERLPAKLPAWKMSTICWICITNKGVGILTACRYRKRSKN